MNNTYEKYFINNARETKITPRIRYIFTKKIRTLRLAIRYTTPCVKLYF